MPTFPTPSDRVPGLADVRPDQEIVPDPCAPAPIPAYPGQEASGLSLAQWQNVFRGVSQYIGPAERRNWAAVRRVMTQINEAGNILNAQGNIQVINAFFHDMFVDNIHVDNIFINNIFLAGLIGNRIWATALLNGSMARTDATGTIDTFSGLSPAPFTGTPATPTTANNILSLTGADNAPVWIARNSSGTWDIVNVQPDYVTNVELQISGNDFQVRITKAVTGAGSWTTWATGSTCP